MARTTETWIHPVTVGAEPTSDRAARWRFRLLLLVVMLAVAAGLFYAIAKAKGGTDSPASGSRGAVVQLTGSEHL